MEPIKEEDTKLNYDEIDDETLHELFGLENFNQKPNVNGEMLDCEDQASTKYVDLLNIFNKYYNILFHKPDLHMFEGVDEDDVTSTNRCLELLYGEMYKYNENDKAGNGELNEIYEPTDIDAKKYDELYVININNKASKVTPSLFSAITYIAHLEGWINTNWSIVNLKNN
jgi:hypothetical protein